MIVLNRDFLINSTSSKGNQQKFFIDNTWYKIDFLGYEALSEAVISRILSANGIDCAKYDITLAEYNGVEQIACKSKNFLKPADDLVSLKRMFEFGDFDKKRFERLSTAEKIQYTANYASLITKIGADEIIGYLHILLFVDAVFLNEDRHFANINFVFDNDEKKWKTAPIFDNGAGLLSDTKIEYPLDGKTLRMAEKVKAKPFSADFEKQLAAVRTLDGADMEMKADLAAIFDFIDKTPYSAAIKERVKILLEFQTKKYGIKLL
ncbi:MAG: hypothetical protein IJR45_06625 [Firmicutes bacterium]|nr:hypothetical protein [Bacillota bacterium]MBQ9605070.1 hypothetical protein [Bacillota bacterium]